MINWTQTNHDPDWPIRTQALLAVERLAISTGGRIPWSEITKGFSHEGQQIHLASRALGIFKPQHMSAALSIKSVQPRAGRPSWYRDQSAGFDTETGLLPYDLVRNPHHPTNASLRLAYERRAPLIYFRAIEPACYEAIWPVWVADFREDGGRDLLAAADPLRKVADSVQDAAPTTDMEVRERSYSLRTTKHRNHQAWFSSRVRSAYGYRCAFSNLPLGKLLVGAHIKSDEYHGPASVPNGICMSTLHHVAFDSYLIGVDPDLGIHVSRNVFDADDGPLLASLQGLDGKCLRVPDEPLARPDPAFLEWRFDRFEAAQT